MYKDDLVLETERLTLRPFVREDIPRVFELLNGNEELVQYLPFNTPKEIGDTEGFFESIGDDQQVFAIIHKQKNILIGLGGINNIKPKHEAYIGYWIHQDFWGQGYVTEFAKKITSWVFEEEYLKLLYGYVFEPNVASKRVLEKVGFTYLGLVPFGTYKNGKYFGRHIFYISRKDA